MEISSIVIDDEPHNIENLMAILTKWGKEVRVVATASTVEEGIAAINAHQPQLLFLDIQLQEQSGFELLQALPHIDFEVIFITAFDQYGIQAIKFSALDYLLKPINIHELQQAIAKAKEKIALKTQNLNLQNLLAFMGAHKSKSPKIALPTLQQTHYVPLDEIIRCESSNNYTTFFLKDQSSILVCKTLKEFVELLKPYHFIRSHQSHLVNVTYVKSLQRENGGTLTLADGTSVPISRQHMEAVKKSLQNFI